MPVSGIIGQNGVIVGGAVFGEVIFLAQEAGDLITQETGDKIIL